MHNYALKKVVFLPKTFFLLLLILLTLTACSKDSDTQTENQNQAEEQEKNQQLQKEQEEKEQAEKQAQEEEIAEKERLEMEEKKEQEKKKPTVIATAKTPIVDKIKERNTNLSIAIKAINGIVINPNEEFSFNKTVGNRTAEKGYKKATGFDENGEKEKVEGGGICQISSTIYQAALNGKFEITERHPHSTKVPYAKEDKDATVSYEGYNFKFKNNRNYPIKLYVSMDKNSVYAKITKVE